MVTLALTACASAVSPEQRARDALTLEAARECQSRYPTITRIDGVDSYGQLKYAYAGSGRDNPGFELCARERAEERLRAARGVARGGPGAVAVPVEITRGLVLVPVTLNGAWRAVLLLDGGAARTVLSPALAKQAGIPVSGDTSAGRPAGRARSLSVGEVVVRDVTVEVGDAYPDASGTRVQGVLGADALRGFRVTVDLGGRRLLLEPAD